MNTRIQQREQIRRGWVLVAAIAIGFALLSMLALTLVPHGHNGNAADFIAILPLLFVGIISPLSLFAPLAHVYVGRVPQAPALASRFQRPPPFLRG
jgi:hypothetical protein